ncbi:FtsW/RodA/SpoVE family cell cycle protein, partial [Microbacterium keratanolyticum]|uniref:FtsW/RodA/SpoVE family cell cycle protein n=2 Tax=Microbacterium keratanolyticum TaxID=67574 RepID=UPI00362745CB
MTQVTRPEAGADNPSRGLAARVTLGRVFAPVSTEFVLIASTTLLLTIFGLVMVLSATSATEGSDGPYGVVMRQGVFAVIGIPVMFLLSRLPVLFWKRIAWPALILATMLQLLVFVPGIGVENDGNRNWIHIAGQNLQPSEFLKLALALWIGYVLYRKQTLLTQWKHVFIP